MLDALNYGYKHKNINLKEYGAEASKVKLFVVIGNKKDKDYQLA